MRPVTLLTDFGLGDYYVGAVKGTLLRLAPDCLPVDLGHAVPPGDVETASFVLAAAAPAFPPGTVHLAVVDPGVGSERRILVVEAAEQLFVAPDNGLLTGVLARHPDAPVRAADRPDLDLPAPGATFHGRDRFSPLAAFLLRGGEAAELGEPVDDPRRLPLRPPERESDRLTGRVAHVDHYGNLVTDLPAVWLDEGLWEARVGRSATRRRAAHYAEIEPGAAAFLTGSLGTLELSLNGDSLARRWSVERGDGVSFRRLDGPG